MSIIEESETMSESQALSPRSDRTDDFSEDDGTPSEDFFSDDECSTGPPLVEPPRAPAPVACKKCATKLARMMASMNVSYCLVFDEHGVATIPKRTGCRDRGTVTINTATWCTCPKIRDFSFTPAAYRSLFA